MLLRVTITAKKKWCMCASLASNELVIWFVMKDIIILLPIKKSTNLITPAYFAALDLTKEKTSKSKSKGKSPGKSLMLNSFGRDKGSAIEIQE